MINKDAVLEYVKGRLGDRVRMAKEIPLESPGISLTVWLEYGSMPPKKVSVLETRDGVFACDKSFRQFGKALKIIRPDLANVDLIAKLVREVSPPQRSVVESEESYGWLSKYKDIWHPPSVESGNLVFFCNDIRRGRWEKFQLSADYDLAIEDVGPGKKIERR